MRRKKCDGKILLKIHSLLLDAGRLRLRIVVNRLHFGVCASATSAATGLDLSNFSVRKSMISASLVFCSSVGSVEEEEEQKVLVVVHQDITTTTTTTATLDCRRSSAPKRPTLSSVFAFSC